MPPLLAAGVSLITDPARGANFLTATSSNLIPGTNYTVLAAVSLSSGGASSSQAASPTILALTGLLVPDTAPPSFTKATVRAVMPSIGSNSSTGAAAGDGTFSIQIDIGLNEEGRVYYVVYGDPGCITGVSGLRCASTKCSSYLQNVLPTWCVHVQEVGRAVVLHCLCTYSFWRLHASHLQLLTVACWSL